MFYLLIIILILTLFLLTQRKVGMNKFLILLVLSYFIALSSMILYISKDSYYYNQIKSYFYLPDFLWRWLFFIQIDKANIIRIMNLSSIGIVMISTYFSFRFLNPVILKVQRTVRCILWIYSTLELIIYDPSINILIYYFLYPDYLTVPDYLQLESVIFSVTRTLNILIILSGLVLLIFALITAPKLKLFRFNYFFLTLSYATLSFLYIYFISATPAFYMKISKISNTYAFRSIHLENNIFIYRFLPYLLIPAIGIIAYCVNVLSRLTSEANLKELCISKEISSSETTSKIFCHYIKNEILAIQSEVDMLLGEESMNAGKESIMKRCNILYERIDEIHQSTKTSELNLKLYSVQTLITKTLEIFSHELENIQTDLLFPKNQVYALIDPVYTEQALHNIINNSIDAMSGVSDKKKHLVIRLTTVNHWIQIDIKDNGKGISKENIDKVFLPFYSSHSYSNHWGIGLTLTYKIILAHEGKIMANSTPGDGTTIRIFLPFVDYGNVNR